MGLVVSNIIVNIVVDDVIIELKGVDTANIEDTTTYEKVYSGSNKVKKGIVKVSGASESDKITLNATFLEKDVSDALKNIFSDLDDGKNTEVKLIIIEKNEARTKIVLNDCIPASKTRQLVIDTDVEGKYTLPFVGKLSTKGEYNL